MSSTINSIADAVVALLAAAPFMPTGTVPCRGYSDWALELRDNDVLHLDCVVDALSVTSKLGSRGSITYTVPVDIIIRKRFTQNTQNDDTGRIEAASLDALVELGEQINELFTPKRLTDFAAGVWQETKILFLPHPLMLYENRQFTGAIKVTFRAEKAIEVAE